MYVRVNPLIGSTYVTIRASGTPDKRIEALDKVLSFRASLSEARWEYPNPQRREKNLGLDYNLRLLER